MWYCTNNKTSSMLFQGSHTISPWLITLYLHSHHHWVKVLHDVHDMQAHFAWARINKASILECTVCCWLSKLGWQYWKHKRTYVDSHEWSDVVEYRQAFVEWFKSTNVNFILETSQETSSLILLHMINIFNGLTNGDAQTLFIFDNAPSH